ncbi:phage head-tail joining protein [Paraburkholderia sp. BR10872]|uniref:phage head-tail joining protein n=1 Tax=Paraburkholderia sp. BR10872 TaxID=3236989 RepID=UPI0034D2AA0D
MAFTQQDLNAVERAIASGTLTVEYSGKKVTFRQVGELLAARDTIKSDLATQNPTARPRSSIAIMERF